MNAKQQMMEYAKMHKVNGLTDEEFVGKAAIEGVVIERTPAHRIVANIKRQGKTITLTETTISTEEELINGKLIGREVQNTVEIIKMEL